MLMGLIMALTDDGNGVPKDRLRLYSLVFWLLLLVLLPDINRFCHESSA